MARGGRGGRSHGHRHHHHHHHHHGIGHHRFGHHRRHFGFHGRRHYWGRRRYGYRRYYGSGSNRVGDFETYLDSIANSVTPPLLFNGMLTIAGKDTTAATHLDTFDLNTAQNYQPQNQAMVQNMWQLQEL